MIDKVETHQRRRAGTKGQHAKRPAERVHQAQTVEAYRQYSDQRHQPDGDGQSRAVRVRDCTVCSVRRLHMDEGGPHRRNDGVKNLKKGSRVKRAERRWSRAPAERLPSRSAVCPNAPGFQARSSADCSARRWRPRRRTTRSWHCRRTRRTRTGSRRRGPRPWRRTAESASAPPALDTWAARTSAR